MVSGVYFKGGFFNVMIKVSYIFSLKSVSWL